MLVLSRMSAQLASLINPTVQVGPFKMWLKLKSLLLSSDQTFCSVCLSWGNLPTNNHLSALKMSSSSRICSTFWKHFNYWPTTSHLRPSAHTLNVAPVHVREAASVITPNRKAHLYIENWHWDLLADLSLIFELCWFMCSPVISLSNQLHRPFMAPISNLMLEEIGKIANICRYQMISSLIIL